MKISTKLLKKLGMELQETRVEKRDEKREIIGKRNKK